MPDDEKTLLEELAELRAQVAALVAAQKPALPDIVPNWKLRTCQVCGAEAEVIDTDPESRVVTLNGEGYCMEHAKKQGVLDGQHIKKPGPKAGP